MTLSLCMIVKNESEVLARALANASTYADEIVIVDTGSDDCTTKIARRFTDRVYERVWTDDFSAARNYGIDRATGEYFMWLDADDIVADASARGIKRLMTELDPSVDIVMLPYSLGNFSFLRERIMRNSPAYRFRGRVHEAVPLGGKVISADYAVTHAKPSSRVGGTRNLDIYKGMRARGETFEPREHYYFGRELYFNCEYSAAADEFKALLERDGAAFKPNLVDGCLMLSRCFDKLGDKDGAFAALLRALEFGAPTGETLCELGFKFFEKKDYRAAAYWFERAAHSKPAPETGAFVDYDCYGFLPYVWLTVCYDRMGDLDAAYYWHRRARKIKPQHPSVKANEAYFAERRVSK